jgi:branched-chain amino acid transport system ATP-binding protein
MLMRSFSMVLAAIGSLLATERWRQPPVKRTTGRSPSPDVLMLDEPSLGLAPLIVKEIFSIIETLRKTGVTIVLVEQNARAALAVADYGYVLEMGEVSLHGPAADLAQDSRVIDTYLGAARKD